VGLLAAAITGVMAVSLTVASCDGNSDPASPGKNGGGKGQHVLSGEAGETIGVDRTGIQGSSVSFNQETGALTVENFNNGGVSTVSASPINYWSQTVTGDLAAGGGIRLDAIADNNETSSLGIDRPQDGSDYVNYTPNFTGAAGDGQFTIVLYRNGGEFARVSNIPDGTVVPVYPPIDPPPPPPPAEPDCCRWLDHNTFLVWRTTGACAWQTIWDHCCKKRVIFDGTTYDNVDQIMFLEQVNGPTPYPYHSFNQIDVTPTGAGLTSPFAITSEYTVSQ
jgi:hypothetical protein